MSVKTNLSKQIQIAKVKSRMSLFPVRSSSLGVLFLQVSFICWCTCIPNLYLSTVKDSKSFYHLHV